MCGEFLPTHQNFREVNFSRHFAAVLGHFVIFAWASSPKIYLLISGRSKPQREVKKKTGRGWQTSSNEMRQQKSFFSSPNVSSFKLPKLKLPFSWCARKFLIQKLNGKSTKVSPLLLSRFWVFFISIFPANESFSCYILSFRFIVVTSALPRLW